MVANLKKARKPIQKTQRKHPAKLQRDAQGRFLPRQPRYTANEVATALGRYLQRDQLTGGAVNSAAERAFAEHSNIRLEQRRRANALQDIENAEQALQNTEYDVVAKARPLTYTPFHPLARPASTLSHLAYTDELGGAPARDAAKREMEKRYLRMAGPVSEAGRRRIEDDALQQLRKAPMSALKYLRSEYAKLNPVFALAPTEQMAAPRPKVAEPWYAPYYGNLQGQPFAQAIGPEWFGPGEPVFVPGAPGAPPPPPPGAPWPPGYYPGGQPPRPPPGESKRRYSDASGPLGPPGSRRPSFQDLGEQVAAAARSRAESRRQSLDALDFKHDADDIALAQAQQRRDAASARLAAARERLAAVQALAAPIPQPPQLPNMPPQQVEVTAPAGVSPYAAQLNQVNGNKAMMEHFQPHFEPLRPAPPEPVEVVQELHAPGAPSGSNEDAKDRLRERKGLAHQVGDVLRAAPQAAKRNAEVLKAAVDAYGADVMAQMPDEYKGYLAEAFESVQKFVPVVRGIAKRDELVKALSSGDIEKVVDLLAIPKAPLQLGVRAATAIPGAAAAVGQRLAPALRPIAQVQLPQPVFAPVGLERERKFSFSGPPVNFTPVSSRRSSFEAPLFSGPGASLFDPQEQAEAEFAALAAPQSDFAAALQAQARRLRPASSRRSSVGRAPSPQSLISNKLKRQVAARRAVLAAEEPGSDEDEFEDVYVPPNERKEVKEAKELRRGPHRAAQPGILREAALSGAPHAVSPLNPRLASGLRFPHHYQRRQRFGRGFVFGEVAREELAAKRAGESEVQAKRRRQQAQAKRRAELQSRGILSGGGVDSAQAYARPTEISGSFPNVWFDGSFAGGPQGTGCCPWRRTNGGWGADPGYAALGIDPSWQFPKGSDTTRVPYRAVVPMPYGYSASVSDRTNQNWQWMKLRAYQPGDRGYALRVGNTGLSGGMIGPQWTWAASAAQGSGYTPQDLLEMQRRGGPERVSMFGGGYTAGMRQPEFRHWGNQTSRWKGGVPARWDYGLHHAGNAPDFPSRPMYPASMIAARPFSGGSMGVGALQGGDSTLHLGYADCGPPQTPRQPYVVPQRSPCTPGGSPIDLSLMHGGQRGRGGYAKQKLVVTRNC